MKSTAVQGAPQLSHRSRQCSLPLNLILLVSCARILKAALAEEFHPASLLHPATSRLDELQIQSDLKLETSLRCTSSGANGTTTFSPLFAAFRQPALPQLLPSDRVCSLSLPIPSWSVCAGRIGDGGGAFQEQSPLLARRYSLA